MRQDTDNNWLELKKNDKSGVESIRAHFTGHAFDPHWHDTYLIGVTEQGVQQFNCRSQKLISRRGTSFLLEPEEMHDGDAPSADGFTYSMLFVSKEYLKEQTSSIFEEMPDDYELSIRSTLSDDPALVTSISSAFMAIHYDEPQIVQDAYLDQMIQRLTAHTTWRKKERIHNKMHKIAFLAQEFMHANLDKDIGLAELAEALDVDRFRLTRAFKSVFGIAPHGYLIQIRLIRARALLAKGVSPVNVATERCFADQSHLGRWFKRCYQLTPADCRKRTNVPDLR